MRQVILIFAMCFPTQSYLVKKMKWTWIFDLLWLNLLNNCHKCNNCATDYLAFHINVMNTIHRNQHWHIACFHYSLPGQHKWACKVGLTSTKQNHNHKLHNSRTHICATNIRNKILSGALRLGKPHLLPKQHCLSKGATACERRNRWQLSL